MIDEYRVAGGVDDLVMMIQEQAFPFEERLGVAVVHFKSGPVVERRVTAFEITGIRKAAVFTVEDVLRDEMEVGAVSVVLGLVTGGEAEVSGARQLVDVFPERTQTVVGDGEIEVRRGVDGDEGIEILALFHDGFKIQFGERCGDRVIADLIGCIILEVLGFSPRVRERGKPV